MKAFQVVKELADILESNTLNEYEENKVFLLCMCYGSQRKTDFIKKVFQFVESRRPPLIGMRL